jgi:type VI secretion system protein ImpH
MEATQINTESNSGLLQSQTPSYSFFQAMREVETTYTHLPRLGHAHSPTQEAVRVHQPADLAFAPNTIDTAAAIENGLLEIEQRFFGLLGPSGPLPTHLTELVRNRDRHAHDDTLQSFLDIFHHRMALLFYRAWSSSKPAVQRDRPMEDRYAIYLGSLLGCGMQQSRSRDAWEDESKQYFAGHLSGFRNNAEGLASILQAVLRAQVTVHSFALSWLRLSQNETSQLGGQPSRSTAHARSNTVGQTAVLGNRIPDRQSAIRICIGPVPFSVFESLLPEKPIRKKLYSILKQYLGVGIQATVQVTLAKDQIPEARLGRMGQLGRTAWLQGKPPTLDRSDYSFQADSYSDWNYVSRKGGSA